MKVARTVTTAVLMGLTLAACGKDKKNNNGGGGNTLTASQATELQQKISIAAPAAGFGELAAFGTFLTFGHVSGLSITTDLSAAAARVVMNGVNAAVRQMPELATGTQQSYTGMGLLFHFANAPSGSGLSDTYGVVAINGFPITGMIVALSDQTSGTIGSDAFGALIHFTGTCTSSSNCTVQSWDGTSGSFNVSATGSSGGSCSGFPGGFGIACNYQSFNGSFNITGTGFGSTTGTRSASLSNQALVGIKLTYDCNTDPEDIC